MGPSSHHETWCIFKSLALTQDEIIAVKREKIENIVGLLTQNFPVPINQRPNPFFFPCLSKEQENSKLMVNLKAGLHLCLNRRFDGTKIANCV